MRFKGGRRSEMSVVERVFARTYDRLRKRALRNRGPWHRKTGNPLWADDHEAEGYLAGARDALDAVAERLEAEGIEELFELRGAGV